MSFLQITDVSHPVTHSIESATGKLCLRDLLQSLRVSGLLGFLCQKYDSILLSTFLKECYYLKQLYHNIYEW